MNSFLDAALFLLLCAVVATGCWRLANGYASRASIAISCFVAFFGMAGTLVWWIGMWRLNSVTTALAFLVALAGLWLAPPLLNRFGGAEIRLRHNRVAIHLDSIEKLLLSYVVLICGVTLFFTLAPPTSSDYDSLVYHLAAPAQWLRAGHAVELAYDHHSYFPFTLESLYAAGLSWRGEVFAKLFHWLMLPVCCAAMWAMGRHFLTSRAGLFGAALWVSLPVVQIEASTAYIDLGLCAFALVAVLAFLHWRETASPRWLLMCGLMCGFCLGTKYLGALIFAWLGVWILLVSVREKRPLRVVWSAAAIGVLVGGGWYVRNWLWTGNPVFPFAYEIFGGHGWNQQMATDYTASQKEFGWGTAPVDFLLLPFRLSLTPLWSVDAGKLHLFETHGMALSSILGPALLAFGVPSMLMKSKPHAVRFCLWTFAFLFLFWAVTAQYLRYLLPAFALLCLVCGWGISKMNARSYLLRGITVATMLSWFTFTPTVTINNAQLVVPVVMGRETREGFLSRTLGVYDSMRWANHNTPADAKFAIWGEPRGFYLQRSYILADDNHNNLIDYSQPLYLQLKSLGITHVLQNQAVERQGGVGGAPPAWDEIVQSGQARQIFSAKDCAVYELK